MPQFDSGGFMEANVCTSPCVTLDAGGVDSEEECKKQIIRMLPTCAMQNRTLKLAEASWR